MSNRGVIVIIEDDVVSVEILHRRLRDIGYEIHISRDGRDGLTLVREVLPDLAIIDMMLPRLHGLEICRRMRREKACAGIPVVMISGVYRDERSRRDAMKAGAHDFFSKPFDFDRLLPRLGELIAEGSHSHAHLTDGIVEEADQRFRVLLWHRLAELDDLWGRLRRSGDTNLVETMRNRVHGLAGAGTVFGFSDLARWGEILAGDLAAPFSLTAELIERINAHLEQVRRAATREYGKPHELKTASAETDKRAPGRATNLVYLYHDDLVFANELSLQMELFGYGVEVFSSRADFEAGLTDRTPDAVVMGFDPARKGFTGEDCPGDLPLILVGNDNAMDTRLEALRAGGHFFTPRPVALEAMLIRLEKMMDKRPEGPIRVLIVVSDTFVAEYLGQALVQGEMLVRTIVDPMTIDEPLYRFNPDLILMDADFPGCSGAELVTLIRAEPRHQAIPILLLAPREQESAAGAYGVVGVDAVLTRPIKPEVLLGAVSHRARRFRELRSQLARDALTGLLNYTTMEEHFQAEIERAKRLRAPCTVAMIDLDTPDAISERYGHTGVDMAMRKLALILSQRLRGSDHLGRFERTSILAVLTSTDSARAFEVLDEIRRDFNHLEITVGKQVFQAGFSCGLASFPRYRKATTLLRSATGALEKARKLGRNRVEMA